MPASLPFARQLWVNGRRAQRVSRNGTTAFGPLSFVGVNVGYTSPDVALSSLSNQADIEFLFHTKEAWYVERCLVSNITAGAHVGSGTGAAVNMRLPCFRGAI